MWSRNLPRGLSSVIVLAAVLAACSDVADPVGVVPVASVEIVPGAVSLFEGDSLVLEVRARSASGVVLTGRSARWSVADTSVVEVASTGRVVGKRAGATTVRAEVEGRSASVTVVVGATPVAEVAFPLSEITLVAGATTVVVAETRAADGRVLLGRSVSWSSDDAAIAVVDPTGRITGLAPGATFVRASSEGRTGSVRVVVNAAAIRRVVVAPSNVTVRINQGVQVYADVRNVDGTPVPGGRIDGWRSENPTVATVSSAGIVQGVAEGTTRIYARSGSVEGSATVHVPPRPWGPHQRYELRLDPSTVYPPVDTVFIEDPRPAHSGTIRLMVYMRRATLRLDVPAGRFVHEFSGQYIDDQGQYWGETAWTVRGSLSYDWLGTGWYLTPDGSTQSVWAVMGYPGELHVRHRVRRGPEIQYRYEFMNGS